MDKKKLAKIELLKKKHQGISFEESFLLIEKGKVSKLEGSFLQEQLVLGVKDKAKQLMNAYSASEIAVFVFSYHDYLSKEEVDSLNERKEKILLNFENSNKDFVKYKQNLKIQTVDDLRNILKNEKVSDNEKIFITNILTEKLLVEVEKIKLSAVPKKIIMFGHRFGQWLDTKTNFELRKIAQKLAFEERFKKIAPNFEELKAARLAELEERRAKLGFKIENKIKNEDERS